MPPGQVRVVTGIFELEYISLVRLLLVESSGGALEAACMMLR